MSSIEERLAAIEGTLNELKNEWRVHKKLSVGNDIDKQVVIEGGKVDSRDILVTTNENNKQSIKEHIENPNAHKSLPLTGGNLKFIDDPNLHVIEQDPEKDGYIGLAKDKIKDANGVPKSSFVINGVTSETDENKQRRMFIDSDSIVIDGEIKGADGITSANGDITATNGSLAAKTGITSTNGNITATNGALGAKTGITSTNGNITATNGTVSGKNITAVGGNITATPNGTIKGKIGDFQTLTLNGINIKTEIDGLKSRMLGLGREIKALSNAYINHNHQFNHVKVSNIPVYNENNFRMPYDKTKVEYPSPLIDEESKRDDTTKPKQVS